MSSPAAGPDTSTCARLLIDLLQRDGVEWGGVDLFAVGPDEPAERLGEFAAVLGLCMHGESPFFHTIRIVYPELAEADVEEWIRARFIKVLTRLRRDVSEADAEQAFRLVEVVRPASLEIEELLRLARDAAPRTALIVGRAALYRGSGVPEIGHEAQLREDVWTPHLHALMDRMGEVAKAAECYVVLDAGEYFPVREELRAMLRSVEHAAIVVGGSATLDDRRRQAARWAQLAADGDIRTVLEELDQQDGLEPLQKSLLRVQLFAAANLPEAIRPEIESHSDLYLDISADIALILAVHAEKVDLDEFATGLLSEAISQLERREHLEEALRLASRLGQGSLVRLTEARLEATFPNSDALRWHRADRLARDGQFGEAAELIRGVPSLSRIAECWRLLDNADLRDVDACRMFLRMVDEQFPEFREDTVGFCAHALVHRGRPAEALDLLSEPGEAGPLTHTRASAALDIVRQTVLRSGNVDEGVLLGVLRAVIESLASRPSDVTLRGKLSRVLSAETLGLRGIAALLYVMLGLVRRWDPARVRDTGLGSVPPLPEDTALNAFVREGWEWLSGQSPLRIGTETYPVERLGISPDQALSVLMHLAEAEAITLRDPTDRKALDGFLALAIAIAPHGTKPGEDLVIAKSAAIRLAHVGHVQYARDWAEQILALTGGNSYRAKLAWRGYADVYARTGNHIEALIGLACSLAVAPLETWADLWEDSMLAFRLLRDMGWGEAAREFLEAAGVAQEHLGLANSRSRLDTAEIQLEIAEWIRSDRREPEPLQELLNRAAENLRRVMAIDDEIAPSAAIFASAIRHARSAGVAIPSNMQALAHSAQSRTDPQTAALIEIEAAPEPTLDQVVTLAQQLEPARYAEDTGYDVHRLTLVAERLLASPAAASDPRVAAYAIEALADQAVASTRAGGDRTRILDTEDGPAEVARRLSAEVPVVLIGIADVRLVRITAVGSSWEEPVIEPVKTFDPDRLREWSVLYPYDYGVSSDDQHFYTSTDRLGVSALPERALVVTSAEIQPFPLNLLQIGDDLAGWTHRLAAAPSLSWLHAARRARFQSGGRRLAWIPHDPRDPEVLTFLADRLGDALQRHGIELSAAAEAPDDAAGSELVVVAAHGGVAERNRYFRVVKDDRATLALSPAGLSRRLANVGVVVLFVCSGGRFDPRPGANAMVGLGAHLLSRGCRAVVASPWPLDTAVPPYWLPTFLAAWESDSRLMDACFEANAAVRRALGAFPRHCLAMNVYGDGLLTRADLVP